LPQVLLELIGKYPSPTSAVSILGVQLIYLLDNFRTGFDLGTSSSLPVLCLNAINPNRYLQTVERAQNTDKLIPR